MKKLYSKERTDKFYEKKILSNIKKMKTGCWEWLKCCNKDGYGQVGYKGKSTGVHRTILIVKGFDVKGKVVDHLCRNRKCCNPKHLRLISTYENIHEKRSLNITNRNKRKKFCNNGHPFNEENTKHTIAYGNPRRYCRICKKEATARSRQKTSP